MPRCARVKSKDGIYHLMVKSIKEVKLFQKDKDKDTYLSFMKGYQRQFGFKVYTYCLMDNHGHFIIDSNGADISKIMHGLNFKYAMNFNKRHKRNGHLFQDRFKSFLITNDRYLITLSAYIHNNVLSIKQYRNAPEKYKYSSLGVYLGLHKDPFDLLDEGFIMQMFGQNVATARSNYYKFIFICDDKKIKEKIEFEDEGTMYKSERNIIMRNFDPEDVMNYVAKLVEMDKLLLYLKYNRASTKGRALAAFLMRYLCDFKISDICRELGNITQSRVSKLCKMGQQLVISDEKYRDIVNEFIKTRPA